MNNAQILQIIGKILIVIGIIASILYGFVNIQSHISQDTNNNICNERNKMFSYALAGVYIGVVASLILLTVSVLLYTKLF